MRDNHKVKYYILIVKFELSRAAIINEMTTTMAIYGISVDKRHIMLIADLMTYRVRKIIHCQFSRCARVNDNPGYYLKEVFSLSCAFSFIFVQ